MSRSSKAKPKKNVKRAKPSKKRPQQRPKKKPAKRPQQRPSHRPQQRPSQRPQQRPQQRPSTRPSDRPGRPDRLDRPGGGRQVNIGNNVRNNVSINRPNRGDWFNESFWGRRGYYPPYYGYRSRGYWWRWATANGIAGWLAWGVTPIYYGYSDMYAYPEEYEEDYYEEQVDTIEESAAAQSSNEWMSLGVFALSKDTGTEVTPNIFIQLAMNKDGIISGTYYNATTNEVFGIEGVTDEKTQRASWKVVDNDNAPIMETGIYDLSEDQTPVLVHFSDGQAQQMLLVRIEEPE